MVWRNSTSCFTLVEVAEPFILMLYQTWARKHSLQVLHVSSADEVYHRWSCQKTPKTLKTAAKFLSFLFELPEVQSFSLNHKIKWRFNLELAPWRGDFFERMLTVVSRKFLRTRSWRMTSIWLQWWKWNVYWTLDHSTMCPQTIQRNPWRLLICWQKGDFCPSLTNVHLLKKIKRKSNSSPEGSVICLNF